MISVVTGGAGFIGSHLVEFLISKGHYVKIIDDISTGQLSNLKEFSKKKFKLYKMDLSKKNKMLDIITKDASYIFHLAGKADIVPSIENPELYFHSNVNGTLHLLESAKKMKVKKFIYAASASCYGLPKKFPTNERSLISTMYPYALTKKFGEDLVLNVPSISFRFFNVYGPRSRTTGAYGAVFGTFLAQKIANKPLTVVGSGEQTRDFIYVKDLVEAIYLGSKSKLRNISLNLGSGKETTVNHIAKLIGGKTIKIPKRPGEPNRSLADISKAKKLLKWRPKHNIDKGVALMLKNLSYWKFAPVWTPKKIKEATKIWFEALGSSKKN